MSKTVRCCTGKIHARCIDGCSCDERLRVGVLRRKYPVFYGKKRGFLVGNDPIKPYIPSIWRNFLDFLAVKRNAEEFGPQPVCSMTQECKTAIEIPCAHTDTMVVFVESNGRRNNKIEFLRPDKQTARWLPDAQAILFKFGVRSYFAEQHLCAAAQNRNENALICAPCTLNDLARVDFVVHRQVRAEQLARCKFARVNDAPADDT